MRDGGRGRVGRRGLGGMVEGRGGLQGERDMNGYTCTYISRLSIRQLRISRALRRWSSAENSEAGSSECLACLL